MNAALLAVNQADADDYQRIYPDTADAKVFMVDEPRKMEGYRVHAVHATHEARHHEGYEEAWWTMHVNRTHTTRLAPRIL
jgi:hypothetical protein